MRSFNWRGNCRSAAIFCGTYPGRAPWLQRISPSIGDEIQQRREQDGFSGAVRADDRKAISGARLEAQVVNDDAAAEGDVQLCDGEQRLPERDRWRADLSHRFARVMDDELCRSRARRGFLSYLRGARGEKWRPESPRRFRTDGQIRQPTYHKMLTARAASNAMMVREISAWSIMPTFAQRDRTAVSVGENAVLVLKARKR